jgi:hypothetical protein
MMLAARSGAGEIPPGDAAEAAVAAQSDGCWPRRRHRYRACPADRASRSGRFAPSLDPRLGGCAPGSEEHERGPPKLLHGGGLLASAVQWGGTQEQVCCPGAHRTAPHRPERREDRLRHSASHRSDRRRLRPSPRGRGGDDAPVPERRAGRLGHARHSDSALPIPLYGEGIETSGPASACLRSRPIHHCLEYAVSYSSAFLLIRPADLRMCEHPSLPESNVRAVKERSEELR